MKKIKNIYVSDDHQRSLVPETGLVADLCSFPESDYQNKGEETLTINKSIPDDHLTATYWG